MKIQILIVLVVLFLGGFGLKVKDFEPSLFRFTSIEEGFRVIDAGQNNIGEVMAFTDLDGDRYTDYVAIQKRNTSKVVFYVWDFQKQQFIQFKRNLPLNKTLPIEQIIVYDLNQDNQNQLIITFNNNGSFITQIFSLSCVTCDLDAVLLPNSQIPGQKAVPTLIDNQGNGIVKLLSFSQTDRSFFFYDFNKNSFVKTSFASIINGNAPTFSPVDRHFTSVIDLNNDCFSDLLIVSYTESQSKSGNKTAKAKSYQLQVYEKQANNNYSLMRTVKLLSETNIEEIRTVTFYDLDNTGSVDLVFLYKTAGKYHLKALINSFSPQNVCELSNEGVFPYADLNLSSLMDFNFLLHQNYEFFQKTILHFNDVNADGLPDIFTLMELDGYAKVLLLINNGNLYFSKYEDQWKAYEINNAIQALFYDFGEDGKMDLMIISEEFKTVGNETTSLYSLTSIVNNLQSDTLHLKIVPLSISSMYAQDQKKIENTFGVTTQWLFTDIDGAKLVKLSNQRFQFNYGMLQLPYAYSGLGRTNNYLEEFTVGYQRYGQKQDWSPIIPNSQLMVYKEKGNWKLETLLKNNERVNDVIYVSIMILLFMGLVIVYLGNKEAQQDKRDHYNFIQLIR